MKKDEVGVFVSLISSCRYHHAPSVSLLKATELVSYSYSYSYSPWAGVSVLPLSLTVVK